MAKKKPKERRPVRRRDESTSDYLRRTDTAQYNTERMFAAEHVVKRMLEGGGSDGVFRFDEDDDDVSFGSAEMNGVDDDRDKDGNGGAWVCVRFYVPNLDIDTEIDQ